MDCISAHALVVPQVEYESGILEARAYASSSPSSSYVSDTVATTGPPSQLSLAIDWPKGSASPLALAEDDVVLLAVSVVDDARRVVPTAALNVTMVVEGPARVLGVGNGDPACLEPDTPVNPRLAWRTTFGGLARLILQVCEDSVAGLNLCWGWTASCAAAGLLPSWDALC